MSAETRELKHTIEKLQHELGSIRARVRAMESREKSRTPPFSKLEGAWRGADFTDEDIEAAKVRVRDIE